MKTKYLHIFVVCLLSLTGACTDPANDEPDAPEADFVTPSTGQNLEAPAEGGVVMITFSTNREWTIEISESNEQLNGVLQNRNGAAGSVTVAFTALPNIGSSMRSTTLKITAGRASASVTVTQPAVSVELPSEEEVRAYLVRLFDDTDGPNWRFRGNWCSELPINQWGSEVKYENGKLSLILGEHNMKGEIDLSGCKALVSLRCSKNQIKKINVSGCPLLTEIQCTNTGLEEIDVEGCLSLRELYAPYNSLRTIHIGWCKTIESLDVSNCRVESLDLSECVSLKTLNCGANLIGELTIPHRENLNELYCYGNYITELNLNGASQLKLLNCSENKIGSLDVGGCRRLRWLYCYDNRLTELDVTDLKEAVSLLYCFTNRLELLDVSGFRELSELHCSDNNLSTLSFNNCRHLRWLYCSYNRLERLSFVGLDLEIFERLDCANNRLKEADLTSLRLTRLWCQGNRLGGEIPEHFDRMVEFEHDARYDYRTSTGTFTDKGYGWWYPGEPDKMSHTR